MSACNWPHSCDCWIRYFCEKCNGYQIATRAVKLRILPEVINFQLLRFVYDVEANLKMKNDALVRFPKVLDMNEYVPGAAYVICCIVHFIKMLILSFNCFVINFRNKADMVYNLSAVLLHLGRSASGGHYIAHIRDERLVVLNTNL